MPEIVLFVVEGKRVEPQFLESVKHCFFANKDVEFITLPNEGCIYQLYSEISIDENLDIFPLLKEKFAESIEKMANIKSRDEISEVYFFFDYDGHATQASDEKIKSMLSLFDSETENGKLYISYPMVEANRHFSNSIDFLNLIFKIEEGVNYKNHVNETSGNEYKQLKKFCRNRWLFLTSAHLSKAHYLTKGEHKLPTTRSELEPLRQENILDSQILKYVGPHKSVAVLGAFPFFLIDYFGESVLNELAANTELQSLFANEDIVAS